MSASEPRWRSAVWMEISNTADTSVRRDFKALAVEWKAACGHLATVKETMQHPAYEKIIELGEGVVPLLLEELAREPHHWFAALRRITGANPVRPRAARRPENDGQVVD